MGFEHNVTLKRLKTKQTIAKTIPMRIAFGRRLLQALRKIEFTEGS